MASQASIEPQAPSVWPKKLLRDETGVLLPNSYAVAFDSAQSPREVAVPWADR